MILGQHRIGARTTTYAALDNDDIYPNKDVNSELESKFWQRCPESCSDDYDIPDHKDAN